MHFESFLILMVPFKLLYFPQCLLGFLFLFSSTFLSCKSEDNRTPKKDRFEFFFAGHAYDHHGLGQRVDSRLEQLDYSQYDRVVLGGDICSEALQEYSTLEYLDSIFDLSNENTFYVIGNHDARNGNLDWYHRFTKRKSYFHHSDQGVVSLVLNTTLNPAYCEDLDLQYDMLKEVCDTIRKASHLMIFHHHAIATDVPGLPDNWAYSNWPYYHWDANCFSPTPSYLQSIYPLLQSVKARGIEVINVIGDAGFNSKGMDMVSNDGIRYLSSGIDNSRFAGDSLALDSVAKDRVLIFTHLPEKRSLAWKFHDLDSLVAVQ